MKKIKMPQTGCLGHCCLLLGAVLLDDVREVGAARQLPPHLAGGTGNLFRARVQRLKQRLFSHAAAFQPMLREGD